MDPCLSNVFRSLLIVLCADEEASVSLSVPHSHVGLPSALPSKEEDAAFRVETPAHEHPWRVQLQLLLVALGLVAVLVGACL